LVKYGFETPDLILGEVPKTKAISLGGIFEILLYVLPFVKPKTQILDRQIRRKTNSTDAVISLNMFLMILN